MSTITNYPIGRFVFFASTISFHIPTNRILLVEDTVHRLPTYNVTTNRHHTRWFLPEGRKEVGESITTTATRTAWEHGGFSTRLLEYKAETGQPKAAYQAHTETFALSLRPFCADGGKQGIYACQYFLGMVDNEVRDPLYGYNFESDEQWFQGELLNVNEGVFLLSQGEVCNRQGKWVWTKTGLEVDWDTDEGQQGSMAVTLLVLRAVYTVKKMVDSDGLDGCGQSMKKMVDGDGQDDCGKTVIAGDA